MKKDLSKEKKNLLKRVILSFNLPETVVNRASSSSSTKNKFIFSLQLKIFKKIQFVSISSFETKLKRRF